MTSSGSFDASSRHLLEHHLGTTRREEPPLSWPQAAGFPYAVVAAPEPVKPSEWMPIVLGENLPAADRAEAQSLFDAVTALNDFAAAQVFAEAPDLADVAGEADEEPPPAAEPAQPYRREAPRVGRNDPCPCGSGRKYKHCCGGAARN